MAWAFAEALAKGDALTIALAFMAAIERSFRTHPVRHRTDDEVKRRGLICQKWFRALREDYGWQVERALSSVGEALTSELNGQHWSPVKGTLYRPDVEILKAAANAARS